MEGHETSAVTMIGIRCLNVPTQHVLMYTSLCFVDKFNFANEVNLNSCQLRCNFQPEGYLVMIIEIHLFGLHLQ